MRKCLRVLVLLVLNSLGFTAEYFVSGSGDDSAAGNASDPWRSLQQAVMRLQPGDILTVRSGSYRESVTFANSGTTEKPIRVKAELEGVVEMEGGVFFGRNCSHLRVEGFHFVNTRGDRPAIEFTGDGEGVTILNNEVRGLVSRGAAAIRVGGTMREFVIEGNHVHHNDTGNQEAIRVHERAKNFRVISNEVNDNTNIGIDIVGWAQFGKPHNGLVAWNICRNNGSNAPWAAGIYLDGPDNIVVEYNISTGQDFGYQLGCEPSDDSSKGNILRYNIACDNFEYGLGIGGFTGGTVHHCQVYNNVFVNNKREIGFSRNGGHHHQIVNNILFNPTGQSINYLGRPRDTVIDFNCYFTGFGETPGSNSILSDPGFVDLAGKHFQLRKGSPCIDSGKAMGEGLTDFSGSKVLVPDMGAFESSD